MVSGFPGVVAAAAVSWWYYAQKSKSKKTAPKGRKNLKKQGREALEKKKGGDWKKRSGKKPRSQPRSHHPSKKGHRKY